MEPVLANDVKSSGSTNKLVLIPKLTLPPILTGPNNKAFVLSGTTTSAVRVCGFMNILALTPPKIVVDPLTFIEPLIVWFPLNTFEPVVAYELVNDDKLSIRTSWIEAVANKSIISLLFDAWEEVKDSKLSKRKSFDCESNCKLSKRESTDCEKIVKFSLDDDKIPLPGKEILSIDAETTWSDLNLLLVL